MKENVESFENLQGNLKSIELLFTDIPYELQCNQRDLPTSAPLEYMEFLPNDRDVQVLSFFAVAQRCEGIFESLNMITRVLLCKHVPRLKLVARGA